MPFNFYDTHTLLMAVQQLTPAATFLRDRYFPTNDASDIFATDDVLVEFRDGSKKLAPFVAPRKGGVFPSPRGDKLCLQNCPTGACGIGPGSDRITISHSTATGKWQLEIKIPLIFLREPLQTAMQVAAMETRFAQSADSH